LRKTDCTYEVARTPVWPKPQRSEHIFLPCFLPLCYGDEAALSIVLRSTMLFVGLVALRSSSASAPRHRPNSDCCTSRWLSDNAVRYSQKVRARPEPTTTGRALERRRK
jgi:hypothetical protein